MSAQRIRNPSLSRTESTNTGITALNLPPTITPLCLLKRTSRDKFELWYTIAILLSRRFNGVTSSVSPDPELVCTILVQRAPTERLLYPMICCAY